MTYSLALPHPLLGTLGGIPEPTLKFDRAFVHAEFGHHQAHRFGDTAVWTAALRWEPEIEPEGLHGRDSSAPAPRSSKARNCPTRGQLQAPEAQTLGKLGRPTRKGRGITPLADRHEHILSAAACAFHRFFFAAAYSAAFAPKCC